MKRLSSIPISTILLYFLIILNGCQKDLHNENANSSEIIDKISSEKELKILSMLTNIPFEERLLTIKNDKGLFDVDVWERKQKMTDMLISKIRTKYNLSPDESHSLIHKSVQKYRKELIRNNKIDDWRIEVIENSLFKSLNVDAVNSLGLQNISKAASLNRLNNDIDTVVIERFTINFVPVYNDLYGFQNLLEQDGCASIAANYVVSNKTRLDYWGPGVREIRTLNEREAANEAISLVYSSYLTAKKACNDSKNTVIDPIGGGGTGGGGGGNGPQTPNGDKEPASYPWRTKLKSVDDFHDYLPKTEGMFKANEDGELIYDENGKPIPILEAYNCHYYAFGPNNDPYSYQNPFKRILGYPDLSNFNKLAPTDKIKIGDRVTYYIWTNTSQHALSAITHSAIVTEVDANGFATMVSSKMGESYGIISHHPRDIPAVYGPTNPITVFSNGEYRYNRIYYRPK